MRPLRALLALSLLLDATGAAASGAARAAGRAHAPAVTVIAVLPVTLPVLNLTDTRPSATPPLTPMTAGSGAPAAPPLLTPAPALAVQDAPPAGPAAIAAGPAAPRSWLGDHEDILLNGTPEQINELEARIGAGEISLQHPGGEAERRALGIIRGVARDWTPRILENRVEAALVFDRKSLTARMSDTHKVHRAHLRRAQARAAGPLERAAIRALGLMAGPGPARQGDDASAREWLLGLSRRSVRAHERELAELLAQRIPGARPERLVLDDLRARRREHWNANGTFHWELTENGRLGPGYVFAVRSEEAELYRVIAHEFTHQGDPGAVRAVQALALLHGEAGEALARVLMEGYTELRARRQMARLREEGLAGGSAPARRYVAALRRVFHTRDDDKAWAAEQARFAAQPYHRFVTVVEGLLARPGGEAALEAFVQRGEVSPVLELIGDERLALMLLTLTHQYASRSDGLRQAYDAMHMPFHFQSWITHVADGTLGAEHLKTLRARAVAIASYAELHLGQGRERRRQLRRLGQARVMHALARGETGQHEVDRAMRRRLVDLIAPARLPKRALLLYMGAPALTAAAAALLLGGWYAPLGVLAAWALADAWNAAFFLRSPSARLDMLVDAAEVEALSPRENR